MLPCLIRRLLCFCTFFFFFPFKMPSFLLGCYDFPVLLAGSLSQRVTRMPLLSPGDRDTRAPGQGAQIRLCLACILGQSCTCPAGSPGPTTWRGSVWTRSDQPEASPDGLERPAVGTRQLSAQPSARRAPPCCGPRGRPTLPVMEPAPLNPGVKGSALFTHQQLPLNLSTSRPAAACHPLSSLLQKLFL